MSSGKCFHQANFKRKSLRDFSFDYHSFVIVVEPLFFSREKNFVLLRIAFFF
ncbi:hypothetical protein C1646_697564 [Rhizophagus diaphanus]|nr:hypothetical protein C1646_697564 [Rhizophagus diaphanus] [Rhizophagus sp. MUCL 43196]